MVEEEESEIKKVCVYSLGTALQTVRDNKGKSLNEETSPVLRNVVNKAFFFRALVLLVTPVCLLTILLVLHQQMIAFCSLQKWRSPSEGLEAAAC